MRIKVAQILLPKSSLGLRPPNRSPSLFHIKCVTLEIHLVNKSEQWAIILPTNLKSRLCSTRNWRKNRGSCLTQEFFFRFYKPTFILHDFSYGLYLNPHHTYRISQFSGKRPNFILNAVNPLRNSNTRQYQSKNAQIYSESAEKRRKTKDSFSPNYFRLPPGTFSGVFSCLKPLKRKLGRSLRQR